MQCACTLIFEFWWQLNQVDADSTYIFYYYFVLCIGYYLPHIEAKLHRKGYTANYVSKSQLWYVILWCAKLYDPVKKKRKLFLYPIDSTKLLINVWLLILGQAYVIFKTRDAADSAVSKINKGCIQLPNGRYYFSFSNLWWSGSMVLCCQLVLLLHLLAYFLISKIPYLISTTNYTCSWCVFFFKILLLHVKFFALVQILI